MRGVEPSYPLRTERLDIRPFEVEDVADVAEYRSRPEVVRFLYWGVRTRDEVAEKLAEQAGLRAFGPESGLKLAVVWRDAGTVIGEVDLHPVSAERSTAEIGFVFNPVHGGKGLATEAAREMLRLGFEEAGLHRVIGRCDAENEASWRLMERLGMRREALFLRNEIMPYSKDLDDPWTSEMVYAMLDAEWAERA